MDISDGAVLLRLFEGVASEEGFAGEVASWPKITQTSWTIEDMTVRTLSPAPELFERPLGVLKSDRARF